MGLLVWVVNCYNKKLWKETLGTEGVELTHGKCHISWVDVSVLSHKCRGRVLTESPCGTFLRCTTGKLWVLVRLA